MFAIIYMMLLYIPSLNFMEMSKNGDNYGHYKMTEVYSEQCRGPKSRNLTTMTCDIIARADSVIGVFHYDFPKPAKFEEVKLTVYNMKDDKKVMLWNYKITEPCKHFVLGVILKTQLQTENCLVKKGKYKFEINITEMTRKFYGVSFFYGVFMFKAVALSKQGNVGCIIFRQTFEKN